MRILHDAIRERQTRARVPTNEGGQHAQTATTTRSKSGDKRGLWPLFSDALCSALSCCSQWLQSYTTLKLGWTLRWSDSGCPLCLDLLSGSELFWSRVMAPALQDPDRAGEWKYEMESYSLNISEPILSKIRQFAALSVFKKKYSRLENGTVDLKDALKLQYAHLISSRVQGGSENLKSPKYNPNASSVPPPDFGLLLGYSTEVPDQEYALIVATLPRNEQAATRRAPGDYTLPLSQNPSSLPGKGSDPSSGRFKKRGKKNPRQDAMGQKTVMDALPRVNKDSWIQLDVFEPIRKLEAEAAAATAAAAAAVAAAAAPAADTAMSSTESAASASAAASAAAPAASPRAGIVVPPNYPLRLSCLVPFPSLTFTIHREPVLVSGNYLKFYRFLSQSVWKLGDKKMLGVGAAAGAAAAATAAAAASSSSAAGASSMAVAVPASSSSASALAEDAPGDDDDDPDADDAADDEDGDDDGDDDDGMRRMTDSSVEEEIVRCILSHFAAKEYKFHSSGREDMDVRMLGNGRQFFLEFIEARRVPRGAAFYAELQSAINASSQYIEVNHLHLSSKAEFAAMKKDVSTKRKKYRCVVWVEDKLSGPDDERLKRLDAIHDLSVAQRTPLRVLHRRSLLTRPKCIYSARTHFVNAHFFYLDVVTSSGTYVKEFVHGDRGRTLPNVGAIVGCRAEILQLDVIGVSAQAHSKRQRRPQHGDGLCAGGAHANRCSVRCFGVQFDSGAAEKA